MKKLILWMLLGAVPLSAQQKSGYRVGEGPSGPLIVSPALPQDSRRETVYETQGKTQRDIAIVPGIYTSPVPLKIPTPRYPKSLKKSRLMLDVEVKGVISRTGEFIDLTLPDSLDADVRSSVTDVVARYRFRPATLDGQPIAILAKIMMHYEIR